MDQPELDPHLHQRALIGLRRVNRISGTAKHLWRPILRLAAEFPDRPMRILDLASGGGDVAIDLARQAEQARVAVHVQGYDISPIAVAYAQEQARTAKLNNVEFAVYDVLQQPLGTTFDVVTCSLFLHHLDDRDAIRVLRTMAGATRHLVLVDDLRRTMFGYAMAWIGSRLITRSPVVHVDGPLSVAGAYSVEEAAKLAEQAGLTGCSIACHWPQRYLLSWRKK
jgi:2-polyprenyl-3-methyl-5-hydroxy-6-metoxy-1,4-benzoquinol methylase